MFWLLMGLSNILFCNPITASWCDFQCVYPDAIFGSVVGWLYRFYWLLECFSGLNSDFSSWGNFSVSNENGFGCSITKFYLSMWIHSKVLRRMNKREKAGGLTDAWGTLGVMIAEWAIPKFRQCSMYLNSQGRASEWYFGRTIKRADVVILRLRSMVTWHEELYLIVFKQWD